MRSACSAAGFAVAVVLAACGSNALAPSAASTSPAMKSVTFSEVATTQHANHDGGAEIIVGSSSSARGAILGRVNAATPPSAAVLVGVFQGEQRTGGHAIQITKIERLGDQLLVHATLTAPPADGFVTQVMTSPAHIVSLAASELAGAKIAILLDETGAERARADIT